jgi:hypothetical protein
MPAEEQSTCEAEKLQVELLGLLWDTEIGIFDDILGDYLFTSMFTFGLCRRAEQDPEYQDQCDDLMEQQMEVVEQIDALDKLLSSLRDMLGEAEKEYRDCLKHGSSIP